VFETHAWHDEGDVVGLGEGRHQCRRVGRPGRRRELSPLATYFAAVIVASIRNLCNLCYNGCNSASSESEAPGPLAPTTKTLRSSGVAMNTLAVALPPTRRLAGLRTLPAL
jgi:hypothetical protein